MKLPMALLAALAAAPCVAQNPEDAPTALDPVVVTATRSEQWQSDIVASTEVITREDIERAQANDLAELLRGVAGVDVARSGGPGSPASVFIRGLESNHTLFLVDGVRFTTETFLNAQIQNLSPEMIERIEIVKGPRSGLWGSDAMGGVVQIFTRRAGAGLTGGASLRTGSYGTRDGSGAIAYGGEAGRIALNLQAQDFGGYPPLRSGTEDRGQENLNGSLNGALELGPVRTGLRHLQASGTNEYVDFFGAPKSQDFTNRVSAFDLSAPVLDDWTTRGSASLTRDELTQREPSDPARPQQFDFTEVERRAFEWENHFHVADVAVAGGFAASRSDIDSAFYSEFGDSFITGRSSQHAFFASLQSGLGPLDAAASARHARHNRFGGHTTGDVALGWRFGDTRLGLAGGTGYKEPELTDLYGSFGNPDLEPERSSTVEANLRQSFGTTQVLTVAAFQTLASNLIVFDSATFLPQNIARTRIRGLEAGWRQAAGPWDLGLSGSMQDPVDRDTGEVLPRRSRRSLQAQAGRGFGQWSAQLEVQAYGERTEVGSAGLGGYAVVNAGLGYALSSNWSLAARGDNLLDKDYELIQGFRTPGRNGSLTLRASF